MKKNHLKIDSRFSSFTCLLLFLLYAYSSIEVKAESEWMHILQDTTIANVVEYKDYAWMVKGKGIFKYDINTREFIDSLNIANANFEKDIFGNLWINYITGFAKFDGTNIINFDKNKMLELGFPDDDIAAFRADKSGNLWISFGYKGFVKFDGNSVTVYNNKTPGMPTDDGGLTYVTSIDFDSKGNVWVTVGLAGIGKFDGKEWFKYNIDNSGIHTNQTLSLIIDKNDFVYIASNFGLIKYDNLGWYLFAKVNSNIPENRLYELNLDSSNNIWCKGGFDSGLIKFDGQSFTSFRRDNSSITNNSIFKIHIDSYDNIWLAMHPSAFKGGVNIFREGGIIKSSVEDQFKSDTDILVSPLPAWDYIELSGINIDDKIEIFDIMGNEIENSNYKGKINISKYPIGVYTIKSGNRKTKFIKSNN